MHLPVVVIEPDAAVGVPVEVVDAHDVGFPARHVRGVGYDSRVFKVLAELVDVFVHAGQVQNRVLDPLTDLRPAGDKGVTQVVPLFEAAQIQALVVEPGGLADCRLHQAGGGIGVVFQDFERVSLGVVDKIKAAVEVVFVPAPGINRQFQCSVA